MAERRRLRALAASGQTEPPRPSRAIIAAATKVQIGDKASVAAVKRRELWQDECWDAFDAVGEVKYGANYLGNALSRLGLYIGVATHDADSDPVPITVDPPEDDEEESPGLVDTATYGAAYDALGRLASGHGGHGELLRETAVNLTIAGECYLYGREESYVLGDDTHVRELWDVRSVNEVVVSGEDRVRIVDSPETSTTKKGVELDPDREDVYLVRIWQRHPRWGGLADSPLRGVLGAAEELLLTEQAVRAIARSRMNAGMLLLPTEISFGAAQGADDDSEDPFLDTLMDAMTTPIQDEGDASAVTPMVVRAAGELLDKVRHVTFDRKMDDQVLDRQRAALRRIAQGMNLPVEVITGMDSVNHWTAWQIEESTFKAHVEPLAIAIVNALTEGYLIPLLEASGVDEPERFCVWYDAARLIARPNIAEAADSAHDRLTISDDAYRRARGFDDTDAPTEEELRARVARNAAKRSATVAGEVSEGVDPATGEGSAPAEPTPTPDELGLRPSSATTVDVARGEGIRVPALLASARVPANLGELLRDVDRDLRNRVEAAADASMRRALERAGAMLRSKAKKNRAAADAIESTPNDHVAATLGPTLVRSLGVEEVELIEGAFDTLGDRFVRWCTAAAEATLDLTPGLDAAERDVLAATYDRYARDAWSWLRDELVTHAEELLYDPDPKAPNHGEWDDVTVVPYRIVRESIARAGGVTDAPIVASLDGQLGAHALGVATGYLSSTTMAEHGVAREAWVWDYGPYRRDQGFEPHTRLDGTVFESFTDDALANLGGFPLTSHYLPGDHAGCRCDVSPVMVDRHGDATPVVDVYADSDPGVLDVGLLVPSPSAPAATLRRHPAGGYTYVDEAGEGYYVRQLTTNEGTPGSWRIERQWRDADGELYATRVGETRTLADARRIVGSDAAGADVAGRGVRDLRT